MSEIIIRKANKADLEILLGFEQGVINAERPYDPTLKKGTISYYDIKGMINNPLVRLVVAQIAEQVVGCGYCRIENAKPYLQHPQHGYLGFMYVVPEHRGKGINKMVLENLAGWARSEKITELRLDVYYSNTAAIKAYEKAGFDKHMVEMRMGL